MEITQINVEKLNSVPRVGEHCTCYDVITQLHSNNLFLFKLASLSALCQCNNPRHKSKMPLGSFLIVICLQ